MVGLTFPLFVYRDLKPANFLISHTGDVKIGDLGIMKQLGGEEERVSNIPTIGNPHGRSRSNSTTGSMSISYANYLQQQSSQVNSRSTSISLQPDTKIESDGIYKPKTIEDEIAAKKKFENEYDLGLYSPAAKNFERKANDFVNPLLLDDEEFSEHDFTPILPGTLNGLPPRKRSVNLGSPIPVGKLLSASPDKSKIPLPTHHHHHSSPHTIGTNCETIKETSESIIITNVNTLPVIDNVKPMDIQTFTDQRVAGVIPKTHTFVGTATYMSP